MKRTDLYFAVAIVAIFLPFVVCEPLYEWYKAFNAAHGMVMSFLKFGILCFQFLSVKTLKSFKTHIEDSLSLYLIKTETLHQTLTSIVVAGADDADNFIDIILGDQQAF